MSSAAPDRIVIRRPDDWHVHLRDDAMLKKVVSYTARQFGRAIVMPNLRPPVTTVAAAERYRDRILKALPAGSKFQPLMTAYLTDTTESPEIEKGFASGVFTAAKMYPANATTNSDAGVTDFRKLYDVFAVMQRLGMPLLIHGEVTDKHVDIFDREAAFIDSTLNTIIKDFPELKVVFEHITTKDAVDFVESAGPLLAATITPHHLVINRTSMFEGGIRPHLFCLPIAKREPHRLALRKAAVSGNPKFFLGTDSAPHAIGDKESSCGCAGIFNAPTAIETYAGVFDQENALHHLEGFASVHGPEFYGLPLNDGYIALERQTNPVPELLEEGGITIVPFWAGEELPWRFAGATDSPQV